MTLDQRIRAIIRTAHLARLVWLDTKRQAHAIKPLHGSYTFEQMADAFAAYQLAKRAEADLYA